MSTFRQTDAQSFCWDLADACSPFVGIWLMHTVEQYRRNAEQCRRVAQEATPPDWGIVLEDMARTWEKLAKLREDDLKAEANN
jgi:hypothetical protein